MWILDVPVFAGRAGEPAKEERMTKHTPRPWTLDVAYGRILDDSGDTVAVMRATCVTDGWMADGHLIAAAPDLLAAVKAVCMEWVNGRRVEDGISLTVRQQIDAAIAKAEER
jgi:hypothetical protein